MILVGNQRGGSKDLARHLLKQENERVDVYDIRGFASNTLMGAFQESYAISRGTQCKQHLYSLSLSPPKAAIVSDLEFKAAIDRAEKELGLNGQPRAIVFHEKHGDDGELRRHAHAVWCRINTKQMKAVQLSFTHNKLQILARELYLENDWQLPCGLLQKGYCDPRNFTLAEWQQAKRRGKDPRLMKALFQDAWAISDTRAAFGHALLERGLILARGDRRGFVAVDHNGEAYSLSRWTGIKPKELRARLGVGSALPNVTKAHQQAASLVINRLEDLQKAEQQAANELRRTTTIERARLQKLHADRLDKLRTKQALRLKKLAKTQEQRYRTGLLGLLDRLTRRRRRIAEQNRIARERAELEKVVERKALTDIFELESRSISTKDSSHRHTVSTDDIGQDIEELRSAFSARNIPPRKSQPRRRPRPRDGPSRQ